MRYVFLLSCALFSLSGCASNSPVTEFSVKENNTYPVILVPGFFGFSREDIEGFYYWGGFSDIESAMRASGYSIYSGTCGPVSSVWDRACELYACIKGGTTDYGEAHSTRYGHARYGRTFPGLYPQWGDVDPSSGRVNKVHLVGHSLGGNTARMLVHLLAQGSEEELSASSDASFVSPLFTGGKNWVCGLLTIVAPHDGTTLMYHPDSIAPSLERILHITTRAERLGFKASIDFMLDQWGIARKDFGTQAEYVDTVIEFVLQYFNEDTATADLSPEGAAAINGAAGVEPSVYYFSWAAYATEPGSDGSEKPSKGLKSSLRSSATYMGAFACHSFQTPKGWVVIDSKWRKNDGIVNTVSMAGPTLNTDDTIISFSGTPLPGVWNFMGTLAHFDHWDAQGLSLFRGPKAGQYRDFRTFLEAQLKLLSELPP